MNFAFCLTEKFFKWQQEHPNAGGNDSEHLWQFEESGLSEWHFYKEGPSEELIYVWCKRGGVTALPPCNCKSSSPVLCSLNCMFLPAMLLSDTSISSSAGSTHLQFWYLFTEI